MIDLPYPEHFKKGRIFQMDEETANVYAVDEKNEVSIYPLRTGLAGYLWMLRLDGDTYLKEVS
jgi:hypothetical protein